MTPAVAETLMADKAGIDKAAALLRNGDLVAFPTETVYGLGADARNSDAVAAIFAAKGRPSFNPLIVHVADLALAEEIAVFDEDARILAKAFWPGPLTLVLPLRPEAGVSPLVTAGLPTIAIRVPEHKLAHRLLTEFGGAVAAPSANPSGKVSPTTAPHVLEGLSKRIAAVLDGGPCPVGVESTILGLNPRPTLLRAGGLPQEDIEACLGQSIGALQDALGTVTAPGQLASHYATTALIRLNASAPREGESMLGFGAIDGNLNLSPAADLREAAANLFDYMRALDRAGHDKIAVATIPNHGLGAAINDRLSRAAKPRP